MLSLKNKYCLGILSIVLSFSIKAQVAIGDVTVDDSSILEIHSDTTGLLIPRVSLTNSTTNLGVTPLESLLVYNNITQNDVVKGFNYWSNSNKWERYIINYDDLTVTANTPWYKIGTSSVSTSYLDDIYVMDEVYIRPDANFVALGLGRILYSDSYASDPDIYSFGHFANSDEGFDISISHGAGTSYSTAETIDNDGAHGISGDWDVGSLRFVGSARLLAGGFFPYTGRTSYAEIKVTSWGNGNISATRAPAQMHFETCEDGTDNPNRIFRIDLQGRIQFSYGRSVANWSTSNLSTDKVVGIRFSKFAKIDKSALLPVNRTANIKAVDIKEFVLKKPSLNISEFDTSIKSTVIINGKNKKSPLMLDDCPMFNNNEDALNEGLQKGMVYKTPLGELKIVY